MSLYYLVCHLRVTDLDLVFCGTFRLRPGNVVRDIVGGHVTEFMTRFSVQWNFVFLDQRLVYLLQQIVIQQTYICK